MKRLASTENDSRTRNGFFQLPQAPPIGPRRLAPDPLPGRCTRTDSRRHRHLVLLRTGERCLATSGRNDAGRPAEQYILARPGSGLPASRCWESAWRGLPRSANFPAGNSFPGPYCCRLPFPHMSPHSWRSGCSITSARFKPRCGAGWDRNCSGSRMCAAGLGVIIVMILAFYPYVYLLARNAFLTQGKRSLEAAQSLGFNRTQGFFKLALPMARPVDRQAG